MNITIISGSQNPESLTIRVATHLQERLNELYPDNHISILDVRAYEIPLDITVYHPDREHPAALSDLITSIYATDAFILLSPEYNGCYTPALKNLLNHFPKFLHKPVGIVTASDGKLGGLRAAQQLQLLTVAHFGVPSATMLIVPQVHLLFEENGHLLDTKFEKQVNIFLEEFMWLARKLA